jgi:CheY-like chemotaxis protein
MTKSRILIAESDEMTAKAIEAHLEKLGYDILAVIPKGEQAIQQTILLKPDLILLDVDLNGRMEGVWVAQEVLNNFNIPIVILTEHAKEKILESVRLPGTFTYLQKPIQTRGWSTIEIAS